MIVLISKDLMMSSTVSSAVRAAGKSCKVVSTVDAARAQIEETPEAVGLLLIDLQTAGLDFDQLAEIAELESVSRPRTVGYAQHVNIDVIKRGRDIGLDQVLTRGQLHGNVAGILGE